MPKLRLYELDYVYQNNIKNHEYPTVSYVKETDTVYYTKKQSIIRATYKSTSTVYSIRLLNSTSGIKKMYIDNNLMDSVITKKIFSIKGSHNVRYIMRDDVTKCTNMFLGCVALQSIDLSSFDTSDITDMSYMFSDCTNLTSVTFGPRADISKVSNCSYMFSGITTTGTLYYDSRYDYSKVIEVLPSTWTATAVDY